MERSVEVMAMIFFAVIGLSHMLQAKAWVQFFSVLRANGEAGAFLEGFLTLPLGGFIVGFHHTWSGIPVLLTLVGWAFVIKGVIRFCAPKTALRIMSRVSLEKAWEFQAAGAGLMVFAGLLGYAAYGR